MKSHEVLTQAVTTLSGATGPALSAARILTVGGDYRPEPPFVRLRLITRRLDLNGANSRAGYTTDESGNETGWELHLYYDAELVCRVTAESEADRDALLDEIQQVFARFESRPHLFHADTFEWRAAEASRESNDYLEPDLYGGAVLVRFRFLTRAFDPAEPLTSIDSDVSVLE
jgi:hypothetical protein